MKILSFDLKLKLLFFLRATWFPHHKDKENYQFYEEGKYIVKDFDRLDLLIIKELKF
jgi:hypothetical protein